MSYCLVDILVCLVTLELESFGIEALSEVNIIDKRRSVPHVPLTPSNPVPSTSGETISH